MTEAPPSEARRRAGPTPGSDARASSRPRPGRVRAAMLPSALALVSCLAGCALPTLEGRTASVAVPAAETADTPLGRAVAERTAEHPGENGVAMLANPRESFAARAVLARAAERTLDVQYYIWHHDTTGTLLMEALREAADRGVRVRLLLDDNGIGDMDDALAALDAHENVEVRIFNPFPIRRFKRAAYVWDFGRLNRRMHNKSFTADSQASVVGGRNVGDEYFGATAGILKSDLDIMLVGPVVDEVSSEFDRYWASDSAYPAGRLLEELGAEERAAELEVIRSVVDAPEARTYLEAVANTPLLEAIRQDALGFVWADVRMVIDDPAKGLGGQEGEALLVGQLDEVLESPSESVVLVSPYFVPGEKGTEAFASLAERGIEVSVLTNALEATDVVAVHAGYAERREDLLEAGVRLYEMQRSSADTKRDAGAGPFGSSASSLHAKTFAVDGERAFVGSFNLDPRSVQLNTEMGFVIDSPVLARQIERAFDDGIPERAYEVHLDDDGSLYWLDRRGDEVVRLDDEPETGWFKQAAVTVLGWLPIEWML